MPSLIHALHRASQVAEERLASALGDVNLTPRQLVVLTAIEASKGASQAGLCQQTGIDRSTMMQVVRSWSRGASSRGNATAMTREPMRFN